MTEQTKTRMYLGRFDGDVLVDVTHFTSMDDRCVPSSIANLIVPGRQSYTDWDGDVWVPLTEGRVTEQRADMGGACCWCEFPQARFKYEPVPASAAVGGFKWMVLRDPRLLGHVLVERARVGHHRRVHRGRDRVGDVMNTFTASNGITLTRDESGRVSASTFSLTKESARALAEFFRAEEDERLGRWRWPENPDYVVYLRPDGQVMVLVESSGQTVYRYRGEADELRDMRSRDGKDIMPATRAAEAYFDAHPEPEPEPKPWHDAKHQEVWVLETDSQEGSPYYVVREDGLFDFYTVYDGGGEPDHLTPADPRITAGRRIWPEVTA